MKIIFSRKGFDSANGGVPSPIFPDGTTLSLADSVPQKSDSLQGRTVVWRIYRPQWWRVCPIVEYWERTGAIWTRNLNAGGLERLPGWRPAFGQVESAQSHLEKPRVSGPGDLFLFFGWFRAVERANGGSWKYVRNAPARTQAVRLATGLRGRARRGDSDARPLRASPGYPGIRT